jgi:hypothetical protein
VPVGPATVRAHHRDLAAGEPAALMLAAVMMMAAMSRRDRGRCANRDEGGKKSAHTQADRSQAGHA